MPTTITTTQHNRSITTIESAWQEQNRPAIQWHNDLTALLGGTLHDLLNSDSSNGEPACRGEFIRP